MDLTPYLESWRARQADERARLEAETARAHEAARRIGVLLHGAGATRVWLIGSLARGTFHFSSDLDFLAEGLAPGPLTALTARAVALAGRGVDVLRAEELDEDWLAHHRRFGVLLVGETDGAEVR